jgi:hypothetical protein
VQLVGVKVPLPSEVKLTVPVGVVAVPLPLSVTVAVHVVDPPIPTVPGVQLTLVPVGRLVTVTVAVPLLPVCVASPPYVAVIVWVPVPIVVGV